jgi:transmembrane 9 superfamily protein 2/4
MKKIGAQLALFDYSCRCCCTMTALKTAVLLLILLIATSCCHAAGPLKKRKERAAHAAAEREKYIELRKAGHDEVSNTAEAKALRDYRLRAKKRKGLLRKRKSSLAAVLFPGVSPEEYMRGEDISMFADLVESKKTQVPFEFYDLPTCPAPEVSYAKKIRKNLGSRLQGHDLKPAPFAMKVGKDMHCTPLCMITMGGKKLRWMRKLVERQYRVQLSLDQLPVLMRSKELNYAVRGYPVGFKAPPSYTGLKNDEYYLYNHLKFTVTYLEDPSQFTGVRITGFDVHPVSIEHQIEGEVTPGTKVATCNAEGAPAVVNDPSSYLALRTGPTGDSLKVLYSYEVEWVTSDLPWSDRWDVYLIGSPDDDIHYFAIVNSLMVVLFLTGAIATIMIRTLRKDISGYNEMQTLEEAQEETGWKLVHGDVFRPPQWHPMLLSVLVGTGAQIGFAFSLSILCAIMKLLNPMNKGQTLTAILVLYVLSGSVAGYVSSRIYKFCDAKAWKQNTILTATALPGALVAMFMVLNLFLSFVGAATAVSFLTIVALFALWTCVSAPLVFIGSYFGLRANKVDVPTKTNQIARVVPEVPWHVQPIVTTFLGGILPFGSVCIELAFIMSALWLHQIYYVMGFLLAVLLILAATCAQVSIVMTYLQLCAEDHRWWWKSFWNTASAGFYLFLYSLWFLSSRLDLVGFLPVVVYLTYMSMIAICFGLFCGSVGFLSSAWFCKTIYGAVKVD